MTIKAVGTIYQDDRDQDTYLVLEEEGEAYYFSRGTFYQGLTRWADKGCRLKDIVEKMIELDKEEIGMLQDAVEAMEDDEDPELGFV